MTRFLCSLALLAAVVPACSSSGGPPPVPDFELLDRNPNSDPPGRLVSPRDQLGFTSAWYFGNGT